jgi:hypothetical protein
MTEEEVYAAIEESPKFARNFVAVENTLKTVEERNPVKPLFPKSAVVGQNEIGMTYIMDFAILTTNQFVTLYKQSPDKIQGVRVLDDMETFEGKRATAVVIPLEGLPEAYRYKRITLWSKSSTLVSQNDMSPEDQLRKAQPLELFAKIVGTGLASRPTCLRHDGLRHLLTHDEIMAKVKEEQDRRVAEEAAALAAGGGDADGRGDDDDDDDDDDAGMGIGIRKVVQDKKKKPATTKAAPSKAKGSQASGDTFGIRNVCLTQSAPRCESYMFLFQSSVIETWSLPDFLREVISKALNGLVL